MRISSEHKTAQHRGNTKIEKQRKHAIHHPIQLQHFTCMKTEEKKKKRQEKIEEEKDKNEGV